MKNRLTFICFVASCLICFVVSRLAASHFFAPLDQQAMVEAQIEVSNPVLHVRYDSNLEAAWPKLPIGNAGDKRLIVRTREANCDCFLKEASVVIAPNESKHLPLRLPMHALAYRSEINLVLVTNDPQQPTLPVTIVVEDSLPGIPASAVSVLDQPDKEAASLGP